MHIPIVVLLHILIIFLSVFWNGRMRTYPHYPFYEYKNARDWSFLEVYIRPNKNDAFLGSFILKSLQNLFRVVLLSSFHEL